MPFSKLRQAIDFLKDRYCFVFPSSISLPAQQSRIDVILKRVRMLSCVLAVCIPAWSLLDLYAFPHALWHELLIARCLAGSAFVAFLLLGQRWLRRDSIRNLQSIYLQLGVLIVVPTLLYIFCTGLPDGISETTAFAHAIIYSYYLMPFVILAILGFFPLTLLESAGISTPFLAAYYFSKGSPDLSHWSSELGMIWSMTMLAVVSVVVSCSQLGMLIQLVSYSSYDSLTNCLGRRSGEEILRSVWHYSVRRNSHFAMAFIDLDNFKSVNDRFGHKTGDIVLANVAAVLKTNLRESDYVIRWGGEEFLVLLPDANIQDATNVFLRMARKGFSLLPDNTVQSVSIGVAERKHEGVVDKDRIIQIADERLYQAKKAGRTRIVGVEVFTLRDVPEKE